MRTINKIIALSCFLFVWATVANAEKMPKADASAAELLLNKFNSIKIVEALVMAPISENKSPVKIHSIDELTDAVEKNILASSEEATQKYVTELPSDEIPTYLADTDDVPSANPMVKKLATLLTQSASSDIEKLKRLHDFVVWRLTYATEVTTPTIEFDDQLNLNRTLVSFFSGVGICNDYSSMFAALARAAGFPTQIVTMSDPANDIFHYWNRVFIKGKWLVVDTTNDNKLESDSDLIIDYSYFLITDQKAAEIGAKNHSYFSIWWSK